MTRPTRTGRPAQMRDHSVPERPATPLELLFDLCFVVAVAVLVLLRLVRNRARGAAP